MHCSLLWFDSRELSHFLRNYEENGKDRNKKGEKCSLNEGNNVTVWPLTFSEKSMSECTACPVPRIRSINSSMAWTWTWTFIDSLPCEGIIDRNMYLTTRLIDKLLWASRLLLTSPANCTAQLNLITSCVLGQEFPPPKKDSTMLTGSEYLNMQQRHAAEDGRKPSLVQT